MLGRRLRLGAAGLAAAALPALASEPDQPAELPNPAAAFCEQRGGSYRIVDTAAGQRGLCRLADGTEVDAWTYFRAHAAPE